VLDKITKDAILNLRNQENLKLKNTIGKIGEKAMELIKVRRHHQITLPANLRRKFRIAEGDYLKVEDKKEGILIKPVKVMDSDQAYFHTKEWQAGEAEADEDIAAGNTVGPFENIEDALDALKTAKI
jgi:AbrB family looped-hinge helix DNA binding protein